MSDFGGKLRLARERRGASLRQISATTKISIAALEALERNDISKLPGGIFSRSFVRSYATEVGLDPDETVHEFLERFQGNPGPFGMPHAAPIQSSIPEEESAFESRQRVAGLVLKVLLVAIPLIVLALYVSMRTRGGPPVSSAIPATQPAPVASSKPPADEATPSAVPIGTSPPATAVATAGARATGMTLELQTTDDCWVRVTVDGKRVLTRVMTAGQKETLEVQDKVVIEVGNAGAFAFAVDGRPGKPLGGPGTVRTIILTKDTLAQFLQ